MTLRNFVLSRLAKLHSFKAALKCFVFARTRRTHTYFAGGSYVLHLKRESRKKKSF